MKRKLTFMLAGLCLVTSFAAFSSPEQDRKQLLKDTKLTFPKIKFDDYIYGSLAMSADAKAQYDSIMEFPPFSVDMEEGKKLWETPFKNGKTFAACFPNKAKNVAGKYPYFDDKAERVVTFENAINDCLKANDEAEMKYGSREMGLLTAHAKSLSDGSKVDVKVKGKGALAAYEKGKQYYYERRGQLNFNCGTCHVNNPGKRTRSEQLSMLPGQASHFPVFRDGTTLITLQARFKQCAKNTRMPILEYNSEEYNNLEYFMTYMSNGLKMKTPVFRK
jgi:L-cysteine S-thiosulfotransferase